VAEQARCAIFVFDPASAELSAFQKGSPPFLSELDRILCRGHLGYARGSSSDSLANPFPNGPEKTLGAMFGSLRVGFRLERSGFFGLKAAFPFRIRAPTTFVIKATAQILAEKVDYIGRFVAESATRS
jgi:hypothetical protein